MAIPEPSNCWTHTEAALATAIAESAAFQTLVETDNSDAASALVFGEQLGQPLNGDHYTKEELENDYRYYAQVYSSPEGPYGKRRGDSRHYWPFGVAIVYIERLVREYERGSAEVPLEIERRFKNTVGDIIDDMIDYFEENGGPHIVEFAIDDGPGVNPRENWDRDGMWQGVGMQITWELPQ